MTSPSSLTLLIRDAQGRYTPASPQQILAAARNVIEQHYLAGTVFNTPSDIKTYLQTKLAGLTYDLHRHRSCVHHLVRDLGTWRQAIKARCALLP